MSRHMLSGSGSMGGGLTEAPGSVSGGMGMRGSEYRGAHGLDRGTGGFRRMRPRSMAPERVPPESVAPQSIIPQRMAPKSRAQPMESRRSEMGGQRLPRWCGGGL
jgi:hypothetical protein